MLFVDLGPFKGQATAAGLQEQAEAKLTGVVPGGRRAQESCKTWLQILYKHQFYERFKFMGHGQV